MLKIDSTAHAIVCQNMFDKIVSSPTDNFAVYLPKSNLKQLLFVKVCLALLKTIFVPCVSARVVLKTHISTTTVFCQGVFDKTVGGNMRAMCFVLKQQQPLHLRPNMDAAEKKEANVTWCLMNISNSIQNSSNSTQNIPSSGQNISSLTQNISSSIQKISSSI